MADLDRLQARQAHRRRGGGVFMFLWSCGFQSPMRVNGGVAAARLVYLPWRSAISRIWSGVVPQQPPAMLREAGLREPSTSRPVMSGVSSKPVSSSGWAGRRSGSRR